MPFPFGRYNLGEMSHNLLHHQPLRQSFQIGLLSQIQMFPHLFQSERVD